MAAPVEVGFKEVSLEGPAVGRFYETPRPGEAGHRRAVLCVGGVGGGWDSPAAGLYPQLCGELAGRGAARGLRVRFRFPTSVAECSADVISGLRFLADNGVTDAALLGHSLGGAVVVAAAAAAAAMPPPRTPTVRAVVTLATQLAGATAPAAQLPPATYLLAIHAADDAVLSPACSERLVRAATLLPASHKTLRLLPAGGHGLQGGGAEAAVRAAVDPLLAQALLDAPPTPPGEGAP